MFVPPHPPAAVPCYEEALPPVQAGPRAREPKGPVGNALENLISTEIVRATSCVAFWTLDNWDQIGASPKCGIATSSKTRGIHRVPVAAFGWMPTTFQYSPQTT